MWWGIDWIGALAWFNFELKYQKGHGNTVADILSWVTTWLDPETVKSILNGVYLQNGTLCQSPQPSHGGRWPMLGTRSMCHCRLPSRLKCKLLSGPKLKEKAWCWAQCWIGWRHRSRQIWRYFWQDMPPVKKVILILCNQQNFTIHQGALYVHLTAQGWDWRSPALCGPQGTPCCHPEWVPLRCRPSRVWLNLVPTVGMFLVARNGQPNVEIPEILCALLAAWGQVVQGTPTPNCVHCTSMDLLHVDFMSIEMTMEPNRLSTGCK